MQAFTLSISVHPRLSIRLLRIRSFIVSIIDISFAILLCNPANPSPATHIFYPNSLVTLAQHAFLRVVEAANSSLECIVSPYPLTYRSALLTRCSITFEPSIVGPV
jgi:hypothetical protein